MTKEVHVLQLIGDATSLKAALRDVDEELEKVTVQADRTQAMLGDGLGRAQDEVVRQSKRGSKAVNQYTKEQIAASKAAAQGRAQFQNLGYQLQDTVVQLEMGTHWTRVLAQQGSQAAAAFGVWGTAIGLALAAFGALYAMIQPAAEDTKELEEALKSLNSELESLDGRLDSWLAKRRAFEQGMTLDEILAQEGLDSAQEQLIQAEDALAAVEEQIRAVGTQWRDMVPFLGTIMDTADIRNAEAAIEELEKVREAAIERIEKIRVQRAEEARQEEAQTAIEIAQAYFDEWLALEKVSLDESTRQREAYYKQQEDLRQSQADTDLQIALQWFDAEMAMQKDQLAEMRRLRTEEAAIAERTLDHLFRNRTLYYSIRFAGDAEVMSQDVAPSGGTMNPGRNWNEMLALGWTPEDLIRIGMKPPSRGGGGSSRGRSQQDALKQYEKSLERQREQIGLTEAQLAVYNALGDSVDKYTDAQIEAAVRATEALNQQKQSVEDLQTAWDMVGSGVEDVIMSVLDGTESFEDAMKKMLQSVISEMFRVLVLQRLLGSATGGTGILGGLASMFGDGAAFNNGKVTPFVSGGVVSSPTLFPMSRGTGLMGEAGPEAIMPLQRTSSGELGVAGPAITINNYTGQEVTVDRTEEMITIAVGRSRQAVASDFTQSMTSGQGTYARAMEAGYTGRRKY